MLQKLIESNSAYIYIMSVMWKQHTKQSGGEDVLWRL